MTKILLTKLTWFSEKYDLTLRNFINLRKGLFRTNLMKYLVEVLSSSPFQFHLGRVLKQAGETGTIKFSEFVSGSRDRSNLRCS